MPGRPPDPRLAGLSERLDWVVNNLCPNSWYATYLRDRHEVYTLWLDARSAGDVPNSPGMSERNWRAAVAEDRLSPAFERWLYILFPDLEPSHLRCEDLAEFVRRGQALASMRQRWHRAIEYFSKNRAMLAQSARRFHLAAESRPVEGVAVADFPLLVQEHWIRKAPLELTEGCEEPWLTVPSPFQAVDAPRLEGLLVDYGSLKGAVTHRNRPRRIDSHHNGEIFRATTVRFDSGGFIGFDYQLAFYFDYVNSCEALGAELADRMLQAGGSEVLGVLPLRGDPESAFELARRVSYPGINCLAIFRGFNSGDLVRGDYFLLHKRDETQLQAQNCIHVLPAGGHQGFSKGARAADCAIFRSVVRETLEELFDKEELSKQSDSWTDFTELPGVRPLVDLLFRGSDRCARIFLHGVGLDPITLKPEVLITIVINWQLAKRRMPGIALKFNWEVTSRLKDAPKRHQWVPLTKEHLIVEARGNMQSLNGKSLDTLPAGAACMLLAARDLELLLRQA